MTSDQRFDRIASAWLDLMPDEMPDRVIDAVLLAAETTPQARRPLVRGPRRSFPMNRMWLAAAAVIIAIVAGGSLLLGTFRAPPVGSTPTSVPSPTPTPLVSGLGRGMGYATTAPEPLTTATWMTDAPAVQGLFHDARLTLDTTAEAALIRITYESGTPPMTMRPVSGGPETLNVVSDEGGSGCRAGDYGVYNLTASEASVDLALASDACQTRASLLARTWTRSLDGVSHGGRGAITAFDPALLVTLPAGAYTGHVGRDSASIDTATASFIAVKDPVGASDPCGASPGAPLTMAPGAAGVVAYLKTLPGFDVRTTPFSIDGRQGVRVTIPTAVDPCPDGAPARGWIWEWRDQTAGNRGWFIRPGDTDVIYLVDVGTDVYLLQWLAPGVTEADEQAVLSSVQFIDALPQTVP
jgi:hypothetical protein